MNTDNRTRIYSALGTLLVVVLVVLWMVFSHLSIAANALGAKNKAEIELAEEFIDFDDLPMMPAPGSDSQAMAKLPEPSDAPSRPVPESGTDVTNSGPVGQPDKTLSTPAESPMKVENKQPKQPGPDAETRREQEEARRQANDQVSNAFSKPNGKHNTANGDGDEANSGRPDGTAHQGNHAGQGSGNAGGGWGLPKYGSVASPVTGSVKMRVTIDFAGNAVDVQVIGGEAPARTNIAVCNACIKEVKSRKFTRPNRDDAPESATAIITYNFR